MAFPERLTGRTARFERWSHSAHGPAFAGLCADPEVMEFIGGPQAPAAAAEVSVRIEEHWAEHGFGLWAAVADGDRCVGFTGVARPSDRWAPEIRAEVEAGWRLAQHGWGRGIATEGAALAIEAIVPLLGLPRVIALIDPVNERSMAVARRLGMSSSGRETASPVGAAVLVMHRLSVAAAA